MTSAEIAAWVAPAMSLAGVYAYGRKHIAGPIIGILSQVPWTVIAYEQHLTGMFVSSFAFGAINAHNLRKWIRKT